MNKDHNNLAEKKIGLTCSYIPEELVLAAGMEPVQIRIMVSEGKHNPSYTCTNMCSYVENLLDSGLSHRFDDLSAIIFANSCDCMRRIYDLWTHYVKTPFSYMLEIPKNRDQSGMAYFIDRLFDLKKILESAFELSISEQDLIKAITIADDRRKIKIGIIEGQKEIPPRLSGRELFSTFVSNPSSARNAMDTNATDPASKPAHALSGEHQKPRLMVIGSRIDGNTLFEMIEKAGGSIILPDFCNGLKHISRRVDPSLPPIEAIAQGYLNSPTGLRMPGFEDRLERISHLIQDYHISGIIYHRLKNCDYGMFETPQLENFSQTNGVPLLVLETDYLWQDTSRIQTRTDAFLEMLSKVHDNFSSLG